MAPSAGAEWWRPAAAPGVGTAGAPAKDSVVPFAALLVFTGLLFLAPQTFVPGFGRLRMALRAARPCERRGPARGAAPRGAALLAALRGVQRRRAAGS